MNLLSGSGAEFAFRAVGTSSSLSVSSTIGAVRSSMSGGVEA